MKIKTLVTLFTILAGLLLAQLVSAKDVGKLPRAISNNAVAQATIEGENRLYSFNGLTEPKDWQAVSNKAMFYSLVTKQGQTIKNVPFKQGRLASIAVTVKNKIYLFGGYTVSEDHQEKSMPDVYRFDPANNSFELFSQMPVSVDDTVALVYKERFIYLISGWHDVGNVGTVQILDTESKKWFYGTPYPGDPVFGHGSGIVGSTMIVVDGVKVTGVKNLKRQFKMSPRSFMGKIDPDDFTQISWTELEKHPGVPKYRLASVGSKSRNQVIFAAGSDNPYNYNGIGYNGNPSAPSDNVFAWDLHKNAWVILKPLETPTMDHRGLVEVNDRFYIIGGMGEGQKVLDKIFEYNPGK